VGRGDAVIADRGRTNAREVSTCSGVRSAFAMRKNNLKPVAARSSPSRCFTLRYCPRWASFFAHSINSSRKPLLSARVYLLDDSIGFLSWKWLGTHMFVTPESSFLVVVLSFPRSRSRFRRYHTRYGWAPGTAQIRITRAPTRLRSECISMFVSGGVSGFCLAQPSIEIVFTPRISLSSISTWSWVLASFAVSLPQYFWFRQR